MFGQTGLKPPAQSGSASQTKTPRYQLSAWWKVKGFSKQFYVVVLQNDTERERERVRDAAGMTLKRQGNKNRSAVASTKA